MFTIFSLILCMALTFANTNALFELTHQKATGVAIAATVIATVAYLLKSTTDASQQLAEQTAENKLLREALRDFMNASDVTIQDFCQIIATTQTGEQSGAMTPLPIAELETYRRQREKSQMIVDAKTVNAMQQWLIQTKPNLPQ